MSSSRHYKNEKTYTLNFDKNEEKEKLDNDENSIKFLKRNIENNTHEVIEDIKIKNIIF